MLSAELQRKQIQVKLVKLLGNNRKESGCLSLTCFEHRQSVAWGQRLRLLEADFAWNVDVKEVNLEDGNIKWWRRTF